jgi:hypothetical protein
MGSIYRPKYKNANGDLVESAVWGLSYYANGRQVRKARRPPRSRRRAVCCARKRATPRRGFPS